MDITTVFGTVILGSNPGGCTRLVSWRWRLLFNIIAIAIICECGIGLVVEYVLAKDETRVRFPYPAQIDLNLDLTSFNLKNNRYPAKGPNFNSLVLLPCLTDRHCYPPLFF
jgi:hypothetical protein